MYGDTAIVTGVMNQRLTIKGKPVAVSVAFTDTFIRRNGQLRAVASHYSDTN